jgi:copper homeostasis protein
MSDHIMVEICVESVEAAIAAERGGADRIELCADLAVGGITPSTRIMRQARKCLRLPINVIIRPRAGDFSYSAREFKVMKQKIQAVKSIGLDGIVVGILDRARRVDVGRTRELVNLAHPLPVTFHRAFDESRDLFEALEAVIQTGAVRLLTSGGKATAGRGADVLARLVVSAAGRISIMPGSGITARNALRLIQRTGVREIHGSLGSAREAGSNGAAVNNRKALLEPRVRALKAILHFE